MNLEELSQWMGKIPLVQAERGIGTSPALMRVIEALAWQYLFRVQGHSRFQFAAGRSAA